MQVSGLQHPVVSARIQHARSETNSGFGSAPCAIGVRGRRRASVGGRGRPVSWRTPSAGYSATGTSQVHSRADLRLSRRSRYRPGVRGADRPERAGRPGNAPNPGLAAVTPTRRHHRPGRPYTPALATMPYGANAQRGADLERACPRRRQWHSVPRVRRAGGDVCCPAVGGGRKGGAELMPCG